jgi:pimeloyl-ACP methyl ester carboxylesterase
MFARAGVVLLILSSQTVLADEWRFPDSTSRPSGAADRTLTSGPIPEFNPKPIRWTTCRIPKLIEAGAQCGFVTVPLDYSKPGGRTIRLAVSRIRHKSPDSEYQGSMLVNPGGPGGSGLIHATLSQLVPNGGADGYDWIGFDTRGVGSSRPSLSCIPDFYGYERPPYVPRTKRIKQAWLQRSERYANACEDNAGALLRHMTTVDIARDLDSIRRALGAEQINYYGFSYGTYLGQVYATLFPGRLNRVVFDGVVDPDSVWYRGNFQQNRAFERNIQVYFDWIAKHDAVYRLGKTRRAVEQRYYREQARLLREPAGGIIGPAEWNDIFLSPTYYVYAWEQVADAFSSWVRERRWTPLRDLFGSPPFEDNGQSVYLAVSCTDAPWVTDTTRYLKDGWRLHAKAPFATWQNTWFNGPCLYWAADSKRRIRIDGRQVDSALLISETYDAATPFSGALRVRELFPNAVLIEGVGGTTHSGSLSGVACTDDLIVEYLKTGALPARTPGRGSDVQCDPVPQPVPSSAQDQRSAPLPISDLRIELAVPIMR